MKTWFVEGKCFYGILVTYWIYLIGKTMRKIVRGLNLGGKWVVLFVPFETMTINKSKNIYQTVTR